MFKQIIDKYYIDENGNIKNIYTNKILNKKINKSGYYFVTISISGKLKDLSVHREVAKAFIPNPNNLQQVNHKDSNKQNNFINNLEWCTNKENMIHAKNNNLLNFTKSKTIAQYNKDNIFLNKFKSCREAARFIGNEKYNSKISLCANGKRKTAYGYKWKYI